MTAALLIFLAILVLVVGWHVFEASWDRRLFAASPGQAAKNISPHQAAALLAENPEVQVLDVRSTREFEDGALPRAVHISIGDPTFRQRLSQLDPQKPVLVYCAGGYRSRKAVPILREMGFITVHHLHRGFLSWRLKKLPVMTSDKPHSSPYS